MKGASQRGELINTAAAAELLGVPPKTLTNWRHLSAGPPYYRVGSGVRYATAELDAWLQGRRVDG